MALYYDDVNRPVTGDRPVFADREAGQPLTKEQLVKNFPKMFADGVGKLHHIRLDPSVDPVQHAPRRVQVALRSKLQGTLEDMAQQYVLAPVTEPTPWISSMVVVSKRNGKLRMSLDDRKDLNVEVDFGTFAWIMLTTFNTPFGRFRWKRMPFVGMSCAPEVFQRKTHELIVGIAGVEVVSDDFCSDWM